MKSGSILDRACEMGAIGIAVSCMLFLVVEAFFGWLFLTISAPLYETSPRDPKAIDLFETAAREEERPRAIDDAWIRIRADHEDGSSYSKLDSILPGERENDPVTRDFIWVEAAVRSGKQAATCPLSYGAVSSRPESPSP